MTLQLITVSNLQLGVATKTIWWLGVTTTWGTRWQGHSIKEIEKHCLSQWLGEWGYEGVEGNVQGWLSLLWYYWQYSRHRHTHTSFPFPTSKSITYRTRENYHYGYFLFISVRYWLSLRTYINFRFCKNLLHLLLGSRYRFARCFLQGKRRKLTFCLVLGLTLLVLHACFQIKFIP